MAKKKKKIIVEDLSEPLIINNLHAVYIYERRLTLLQRIPYKWQLDLKKIMEIKNPQ